MSALCVIDQVPATVGNLCTGCVTKLHATVLQVPRLLVELDVTITKQARQSVTGGSGGGGERPLVLNLAASDAAGQVKMWLRAVAHLTVASGEPVPVGMRDLAAWTARRLSVAARHPEIAAYWAGLMNAIAEGMRCIDRAPERRVVGVCECGMALVATRSEGVVECRTCNRVYEISEWIAYRDSKVLDLVATPTEICAYFASAFDVKLTDNEIRRWKRKGLLSAAQETPTRRKYRVGDVVATWESWYGKGLPGRRAEADSSGAV